MATNKHATIRYHALDLCFSNTGRKYFIDDLIEACNTALYEISGVDDGVKRRQVFDDIKFMESEQGWSIPLERLKEGKKVYYRYSDKSFSIKKQAINETEAKQLQETLSILSRFKGMPQFEWMEELLIRIESTFHLKGADKEIVGFEQNPFLKGLDFFTDVFNAIGHGNVLAIDYQSFKQPEPVVMIIHPYYLKEYNNRWFLFGLNDELECLSNLALDRIIEIKDVSKPYKENTEIDFKEYFEDVVGVTVQDEQPSKIVLQINNSLWPYIETKPIHGSQKLKSKGTEFVSVELFVQINYEMTALLFSYGEGIKVIEPEILRDTLRNKAELMVKNYL